jgi:pimeloyl-ACP methyl ester carboxylesterase
VSGLLGSNFTNVRKLDCPVVIMGGRYDYAVPTIVAEKWFKALTAPVKHFFWFENTAHMVQMERPGSSRCT